MLTRVLAAGMLACCSYAATLDIARAAPTISGDYYEEVASVICNQVPCRLSFSAIPTSKSPDSSSVTLKEVSCFLSVLGRTDAGIFSLNTPNENIVNSTRGRAITINGSIIFTIVGQPAPILPGNTVDTSLFFKVAAGHYPVIYFQTNKSMSARCTLSGTVNFP